MITIEHDRGLAPRTKRTFRSHSHTSHVDHGVCTDGPGLIEASKNSDDAQHRSRRRPPPGRPRAGIYPPPTPLPRCTCRCSAGRCSRAGRCRHLDRRRSDRLLGRAPVLRGPLQPQLRGPGLRCPVAVDPAAGAEPRHQDDHAGEGDRDPAEQQGDADVGPVQQGGPTNRGMGLTVSNQPVMCSGQKKNLFSFWNNEPTIRTTTAATTRIHGRLKVKPLNPDGRRVGAAPSRSDGPSVGGLVRVGLVGHGRASSEVAVISRTYGEISVRRQNQSSSANHPP